ncbi:MAG: hypothetical protein P1U89_26755 [Verrucomicrobiales bacterium]|nr:hypothetical protein [Verrucomicrobiales bacterium]
MRTVYDTNNGRFDLGPKIASGGEGTIFPVESAPHICAKVYHKNCIPNQRAQRKLEILISKSQRLTNVAALPIGFATNSSSVVGVFLPFIDGFEIFELYSPQSRMQHFGAIDFRFLLRTAVNLSAAFGALHDEGIVVGDVSEQNVKVRKDATVRLIDSDSFQVESGSELYHCNVGTPLWTPGELHGQDLAKVKRLPNHDSFGLAQLVFQLLFAGRNPFAGKPTSNQYLTPEQAIKECQFAYSTTPNSNRKLVPPPGSPNFSAVPPSLQSLFERSFGVESSQWPRPTPTEWYTELINFQDSLRRCGKSSSHYYWKNASGCPWCEIERLVGVDLFPNFGGGTENRTTASSNILAKLRRIKILLVPLEIPPETNICASPLPPKPTGTGAWLKKEISQKWWAKSWLMSDYQKHFVKIDSLERQIQQLQVENQQYTNEYKVNGSSLVKKARQIESVLSSPQKIKTEITNKYKLKRRELEMKRHLGSFLLIRASISGIGDSRKATMQSYGINCAADVTSSTIIQIPGFGPHLTTKVVDWRKACERRFRFDPNKPFDKTDLAQIDSEVRKQLREMEKDALKLENQFSVINRKYQSHVRQTQTQQVQLYQELWTAKVNADTLRRHLNRYGVEV